MPRTTEAGQTIVFLALAMVALLAMTGLVIDGGNAFAQQRATQNAMDAASEAGATVLVQNLPFTTRSQTGPKTDSDVLSAVVTVSDTNGVSTPTADYTDINGQPIGVTVGSLGLVPPPANAYGVRANGSRSFGTFFGGVVGLTSFTASASATAVAGGLTGTCSDPSCGFIPVTFPTALTTCDGTNSQVSFGNGGPYAIAIPPLGPSNEVIVPLCSTTDGSVGWLDLQPHPAQCNGNGTDFLACEILNGTTTQLTIPMWVATQTGNTNNNNVQAALDTLSGHVVGSYEPGLDKLVTIPLYDCLANNVGQVSPGPACPNPPVTGVGNNTYYHVVALGGFVLDKAYVQQVNPECNQGPGSTFVGGNGGTGCLKGWIVEIVNSGTVGMPTPDSAAFGVQLKR